MKYICPIVKTLSLIKPSVGIDVIEYCIMPFVRNYKSENVIRGRFRKCLEVILYRNNRNKIKE